MDPTKIRFLSEIFEKENRNIKIQEKFIPSLRTKPVTGKFYAKHDALTLEEVPEEYVKLIKRKEEAIPKDLYSYPAPTANMEYGWFIEPLIPRSKDPRLYFATKRSKFLKTELEIKQLDKYLPVKKFVGIPFRC